MIRYRNLAPVAAILLGSCAIFDGHCIYEIRNLQGAGHVDDLGAPLVTAELTLFEQRDSDPNKDIHWIISGTTLKGHVLSAALKDVSAPTQVLLNLDIADP